MSHFVVMVIGPETPEEVDKALCPFQELDLDRKEIINDSRSEFEKKFTIKQAHKEYEKFLDSCPTQEQLDYARENLLKNSTNNNFLEPINKEEFKKYCKSNKLDEYNIGIEITKDKYLTLEDWISDWHDYYLNKSNTHWGYYCNPNAKWDWYQIGGRWTGYFRVKEGEIGALGESSWCNKNIKLEASQVDMARIGDIDFEAMYCAMRIKAENNWEEGQKEENKRAVGTNKSVIKYFMYGIEKGETKEEYIDKECSCATFAVIKDGQWYEKGEMGWWNLVSNEKEEDDWNKEFNKLIKSLSEDTMLTIVDCHI